jgi:sugar phosphate isomerase/epimerase
MKITFTAIAFAALSLLPLQMNSFAQFSSAGLGADFKGPVGLQLYSLRSQFGRDVPGTLDKVQKLSIRYAELAGTYGQSPEDFKAALLAHNITPISAHFGYDLYKDHLDDVVKQAETLGLKYSGCAWIPHKGDFDEKTCTEAADVFNRAGKELAKHGIKFFYHTHGYEFVTNADGTTLFDSLMAKTDPQYVSYEMDIFWIVFPGQDPVKLMEKYPNRFELMHLKDMKKGLETGSLKGGTDVSNDVTIGTGQMDIPAILHEAAKIGVKWYFIEDESPSSEEQIPLSLDYLSKVRFP